MDKSAIEKISELAIAAARGFIPNELTEDLVALPENVKLHDLERYLSKPRRFRGTMSTPALADFLGYVKRQGACEVYAHRSKAKNAAVVDLSATAIFNIGTIQEPGHADHRAELVIPPTPDFVRFVGATQGGLNQQSLIDLFEDMGGTATFTAGSGEDMGRIANATAVAAIRQVKIIRKSERETAVEDFSKSRSALDSVEASSRLGLPSGLLFEGELYEGLGTQSLWARLSIRGDDDNPTFALRIPRLESALVAAESSLAQILRERLPEVSVVVGDFTR